MANSDTPRGLWPIRHLCGGEIRANKYIVTPGATIYRGDIVEMVNGGTVDPAAAGDATKVIGVAAEYVSDSGSVGNKEILVYDDPMIVFGIQATTGQIPSAATSKGLSADAITYAAGNGEISITELAAMSAQTAQFHCLGKVDSPDNNWGEHVKLEVIFNEHRFKASTGSAGI